MLTLAAPERAAAADDTLAQVMSKQALILLQMTKSACLITMGAPPKFHQNLIQKKSDDFHTAMDGLVTSLPRDVNFSAVLQSTPTVVASVGQIAAGDRNPVPFRLMLVHSGVVIDNFAPLIRDNTAMTDESVSKAVAMVMQLQISSQEIVRDMCLVSAGLSSAASLERLTHQLESFEATLADLMDGNADKGIEKAPSIQVKFALKEVVTKWNSVRPAVEATLDGAPLEVDDILLASVSVDAMIKKLQKALDQYAKV